METGLIVGGFLLMFLFLVWKRMSLGPHMTKTIASGSGNHWAVCQTRGNREIQADMGWVSESPAGRMAVLADGIGKVNTGRLCAQIAMDTVLDAFEPYRILSNPEYLLRSSFLDANSRIQKTIGNRRGGASLGAAYTDGNYLYYGLAGNIRIALFRNGELIPISKGHTMDVLAVGAYKEGRLPKQETLWSLEETKVWNYLGKDGFREIELCEQPVKIKKGDIILLISCGIFEEVPWAEMEDMLAENMSLDEKAAGIVMAAERKSSHDKENGSVLLMQAEVLDEKDQF